MSKYADKKFWADAADRVIATFAQSAVAVLSADAAGILDVDFGEVASVAGLAALVALLTSIGWRGRESEASTVGAVQGDAEPEGDDAEGDGGVIMIEGDAVGSDEPSEEASSAEVFDYVARATGAPAVEADELPSRRSLRETD